MGPPRGALFPSTRWTQVIAAQKDPALRREVLEGLIGTRWKALYFLARRNLDASSAEDAVQSFLARLMTSDDEQSFLDRLDPNEGSLRAYLKAAFRRHLINLHEKAAAEKRGGGAVPESLDELEQQIAGSSRTPEQLFDRAWAASLFAQALEALRHEFESGARQGPFEVMEQLLAFGHTESYEALAARHGMSVSQLKAFVHRSKRRYRALLEERVVQTLGEEDDVQGEVRRLLEDLAR